MRGGGCSPGPATSRGLALQAATQGLEQLASSFIANSVGEWAGWQCDFGRGGAVVPVADKYLSETMIAYGQAPAGFELLSTESADGGDGGGGGLRRRFLRVLPEEGCAVSDLAAEVSTSTLTADVLRTRLRGSAGLGAFALDDPPEGDARPAWYLRTTFFTPPGAATETSRVRVSLRFTGQRLAATKPIRIASERRWAAAGALDAELRNGGSGATTAIGQWRTGLDASFVAETVAARCFAGSRARSSSAAAAADDAEATADTARVLELPPAVAVRVQECEGGCYLDVSLGRTGSSGADESVVVRRTFGASGELERVEVGTIANVG